MDWITEECQVVPRWEGNIDYLYLDSDDPPNATTGQGHLVASVQKSVLLPWRTASGVVATNAAICADWARVVAMPGGHAAGFYKSPDGLTLLQSDIDALTLQSVTAMSTPLHTLFPKFDLFPLPAQVAIADMVYGLGIGKLQRSYPKFCAAVNTQDWAIAAVQSGRNVAMPAFAPRNSWTSQQFLAAAQAANN
jgi:GH24 family phage-related lysozyme (muramidase)